jgi:hypothetical protein
VGFSLCRPRFHQLAALLERVAAAVSLLIESSLELKEAANRGGLQTKS